MMNVIAITVVLATVITSRVVSPNDGNIKISISPQETEQKAKTEYASDVIDTLSQKVNEPERSFYANRIEMIQGLIFLAILSITMFNIFYLEPRATKLMRERMKLEKEEGKGIDVFDIEPSTRDVDALMDPSGIKTGKTTTHEPLEIQQELSKGAGRERPQVDILSGRLKKFNVNIIISQCTYTNRSYLSPCPP